MRLFRVFSTKKNKDIKRFIYNFYTQKQLSIFFDEMTHFEMCKNDFLAKILRNKKYSYKYIDEDGNYIFEKIEKDFLTYGSEYDIMVQENDTKQYFEVKLHDLSKQIKDNDIINCMSAILHGENTDKFDEKLLKKSVYRIEKYNLLKGVSEYVEKESIESNYTDRFGNKYNKYTSKFNFDRYSLFFQVYNSYINWILWKSKYTHYYRDTIKENLEDIKEEVRNIVLYRGIKKAIYALQVENFPIKNYTYEMKLDENGLFEKWQYVKLPDKRTNNIHLVTFTDLFQFVSSRCTSIIQRYIRNNYFGNINNTISELQEKEYDYDENSNSMLNMLQDYTAKLNFDIVEGKIWEKNLIDSVKGSLTEYQLAMVKDIMRGKPLRKYGGNNIERLKTKLHKIGICNLVCYNADKQKLDTNHVTTQVIDHVQGKYGYNDICTTFRDYVQTDVAKDDNFDYIQYEKKYKHVEYEYNSIKDLVSDIKIDEKLHAKIEEYRKSVKNK